MTPKIPIVIKEFRCNVVQETQEVTDNDDDNNNENINSNLHARNCQKLPCTALSQFAQQLYEVGSVIPISQMRELGTEK